MKAIRPRICRRAAICYFCRVKIYLRILGYAKPLSKYVPPYALFAILSVIFGIANFTLLIPLLNILFGTDQLPTQLPEPQFSFSVSYVISYFKFHFSSILHQYGKVEALTFVCIVIFSAVLLTNVFRYLAQAVMSSMRAKVVTNIRRELFEKITKLDYSFFHHERKGKLMSHLSNDIGEIENSVVSSIQVIFREPLLIIGYLVMLFVLSPKLTWFTVIVLPASGFLIATLTKRLRRDAKEGQQLLGDLLSVIEETISGVRIIKAFNAEKQTNARFDSLNQRYRNMLRRMWNRKELATPTSEVLGVGLVICVLLYGGTLVLSSSGDFTASEFITYIAVYSQILTPAKNISGAISNIQRGLISAEQIFKIIDVPVKIQDGPNALPLKNFENSIEYKSVYFSYLREENGYVLKDINLTIPKGKTIALVGQSGSGKTTLAEMLPRFYDLEKGEILLDGKNIKEYKLRDLRELMGVVNQESILFNDTVFNNIAFGKPEASEEEIIHAARIANAHDFISQMPEGYQTNIGDRGGKLSGGQRQRISIARAVLKNPPILILDEATSALDTESERLVQDAITRLMKNRTTLVIAHRLSTIQHADEIIVMQHGAIIERGHHEELLAKAGVYKKLYELQAFV